MYRVYYNTGSLTTLRRGCAGLGQVLSRVRWKSGATDGLTLDA